MPRKVAVQSPLTREEQALVVAYLPLAGAVARRQSRNLVRYRNEIRSAARMGLIDAARTYKPARKIKFSTWARYRIRGAVSDFKRTIRPAESLVPYHEEGNRIVWGCRPEGDPAKRVEDAEQCDRLLSRLPPDDAALIRAIYLEGLSPGEAAEKLGMSLAKAYRVHSRSLRSLSDTFQTS